jgi:hypothetical protein
LLAAAFPAAFPPPELRAPRTGIRSEPLRPPPGEGDRLAAFLVALLVGLPTLPALRAFPDPVLRFFANDDRVFFTWDPT